LTVIGPVPGLPNLVAATGHNPTGILLVPVTAELVAEGLP
jgi:glycine/D-amino acid oxidase-like deaminating enzyme